MDDITHAKATHEAREAVLDLVRMISDEEWEATCGALDYGIHAAELLLGDATIQESGRRKLVELRYLRRRYLEAQHAANLANLFSGQ